MTDSVIGPTIVAYHACDLDVGTKIVEGEIRHLEPSQNPYDWLGDGIYFFEDDLLRAQHFAETAAKHPEKQYTRRPIKIPYVIGAVLRLGNCLDLTKQASIAEFKKTYDSLVANKKPDESMPENKQAGPDDNEFILRNLDRAMINFIHSQRVDSKLTPFDSVRGLFFQGGPVVPTSAVGHLSHVQIAVRNTGCILGYFHPARPTEDVFQGLNSKPSRSPYIRQRT